MRSNLPRLRELREQKGATQKDLADALGFNARSILRWEKGESDPILSDLRRIAVYFEVSVGYLIGEVDSPEPVRPGIHPALLNLLEGLPPAGQTLGPKRRAAVIEAFKPTINLIYPEDEGD